MIKPMYVVFSLSVALALGGCQQDSPPSTAAASANGAATIVAVSNPLFSIEPASMTACDPAATGTVKWDVRNAHSELQAVAVWAGTGSDAKLFASGGAKGDATTGPWVRPGSAFELKDPATDKVLGRIKVGGPVCH